MLAFYFRSFTLRLSVYARVRLCTHMNPPGAVEQHSLLVAEGGADGRPAEHQEPGGQVVVEALRLLLPAHRHRGQAEVQLTRQQREKLAGEVGQAEEVGQRPMSAHLSHSSQQLLSN